MNSRSIEILNLLRSRNIHHRFVNYGKPLRSINEVAEQKGIVREQLVKAILLREKKKRRYAVACVSGSARLDPQAVREQALPECRRLTFASADEIRTVAGCVIGAVSPLCLPNDVPLIFDQAILKHLRVNIGSGDPSVGLELSTIDLVALARPRVASIIEREADSPRDELIKTESTCQPSVWPMQPLPQTIRQI